MRNILPIMAFFSEQGFPDAKSGETSLSYFDVISLGVLLGFSSASTLGQQRRTRRHMCDTGIIEFFSV